MYTATVLSDVTITWDHSQTTVPAGSVVNLLSGGPLEAAIGTGNLQATGSELDIGGVAAAVSN